MSDNMGRPIKNRHGVATHQWRSWSNTQKRVFNTLYAKMNPKNQRHFMAITATSLTRSHWNFLRWMAAHAAAQAAEPRKQ